MTAPSPEQIEKWREKFESKYTSEELFFQCGEYSDRYIQHEWQGYLRRCTEQATEIAALKAQIVELMPLARYAATLFYEGVVYQTNGMACGVLNPNGVGYAPNIEATITKLLKD